jgi:hypothetical protein
MNLNDDIRKVIETARQQTAQAVNSNLVMMYWQIGKRIRQDVLGNERAEYGKGFTEETLWRMMQFAGVFLDADIVATLSRQLSWSVRTLRHKIGHLLYVRNAVAKKPEELIADDIAALRDEDRLTPDMVFLLARERLATQDQRRLNQNTDPE